MAAGLRWTASARRASSGGVWRGLTSYGDPGFSRFLRGAFLSSAGYDAEDLDRPVVGIADTSSDYTTCHRQMPELVAAVSRGVLEAGGLPLVFPTASLGEPLLSPTSMLFRNLVAMVTEELIRAQPMDAVVLLGGCDKTVPAQLMAAVSADVPAVSVVTGPMLTSSWRGERLGACSDCRRHWAEYRAGTLDDTAIDEVQTALCPTAGTCMVMGTASTMACIAEALGMMLPGGATAPAASGDRLRNAVQSGRRAVALAEAGLRPSEIVTRESLENAITVLAAVGGSTNAVIHLLAVARRARVALTLDDFDRIARRTPLIVNCRPAGDRYLEDLHRAGGVPVLLKALEPLLHRSALRIDGRTVGDSLDDSAPPPPWQSVVHTLEAPFAGPEALAVLRGSLAPDGALIKTAAASRELLRHVGPALVFDSAEEAAQRLDDPELDVTPAHVLVLRNAGPKAAGMPEAGSLPIPRRLAAQGVRDMVRISDARMSGTSYGTVVLHCAPEAAAAGPLAFVRDGDPVELHVAERRLDLLVDEGELATRRPVASPSPAERGWLWLHQQHVLSASVGGDLDFLAPPSG